MPIWKKQPDTSDTGRKRSELRIHCDQDKRFRLAEDDEPNMKRTNEDLPKNADRLPQDQVWIDDKNQQRHVGVLCCTNPATQACTRPNGQLEDPDQHPGRSTTTVRAISLFLVIY